MSRASVPASIRSSFVITPIVRRPEGGIKGIEKPWWWITNECDNVRKCLLTLWVDIFGQFESIWVGEVHVCWSHSQDETVLLTDELHDHVSDLILDVRGLVAYRDLCDARQVNQSQVQHWRKRRKQVSSQVYMWWRGSGWCLLFVLPLGEWIRRLMGTGEIPLLDPVTLRVSASISWQISSKSVNFFPLQCRNSPYSNESGRA